MTFRCAAPQASLTATISSYTRWWSPERNAPRSITMSISSAPARTASTVSATLIEVKLWPEGNAVATEATLTVVPRRCSTQSAMRSGYTHTAATDGTVESPGFGRTALAHMAVTLPGVSAPSSVVRSMQRTARSSAHSLDDFLIERFPSEAARSSAPTWSTLRTPRMSEPRCVSESAVAMRGLCDAVNRPAEASPSREVDERRCRPSHEPEKKSCPSHSTREDRRPQLDAGRGLPPARRPHRPPPRLDGAALLPLARDRRDTRRAC